MKTLSFQTFRFDRRSRASEYYLNKFYSCGIKQTKACIINQNISFVTLWDFKTHQSVYSVPSANLEGQIINETNSYLEG